MNNEYNKPVVCVCCAKTYDYADEPQEVKEGGDHICVECWNEDNGAQDE